MILNWLGIFTSKGEFYPFETEILRSVIRRIGGEKGSQLRRQVAAVNHIQRHREGKEVNMYCLKKGEEAFEPELRFADPPDEELLASIVLRDPHENRVLKTEVWMAAGRIFSLEFDKPPKKFFKGVPLDVVETEITIT